MTNFDAIDKNVIITGGATGVFRYALAKHFLQNGAQTIGFFDAVNDNDNIIQTLQNELNNNVRVEFYRTDLKQRSDIGQAFSRFVSQFGNVNLVVNATTSETIENNLIATMNCSYEAFDWMSFRNHGYGGKIVNIAIVLSNMLYPFTPAYTTSLNHNILAFTKAMANETNYRLHGVEFLTICPGNIDLKNLMLQIKHELNGEAVAEKWSTISSLTADIFARQLYKVLTVAKNGSIWVINDKNRIEYKPEAKI